MIDKIRGEVTLIVRDKNTEEIIEQHTQENIITEWFYYRLRDTWQFAFNIVVTNALMESSRFTVYWPGTGTAGIVTSYPSRVIPALGLYSSYVPAAGSTEAYVQIAGRYDAPAIGSTRVINSVGLSARYATFYGAPTTGPDTDSSQLNYNSGTVPNPMAFLKLVATCTQTDQQVVDVYYRLFFPITATPNNLAKFQYLTRFVSADWVSTNYGSFPTASRTFPFKLPKVKSGDENYTVLPSLTYSNLNGFANAYFNLGSTQTTGSNLVGARTINYTDTNFSDAAGLMITSNVFLTNTPTYFTNMSIGNKIQNLIGTGPESTNPLSPSFLDVDNLPSGTGKVYTGGTWNNIDTPSGTGLYYSSRLPEYTRIKITTSGAVGVSQYKLIRQKFFGYLPKYNSWTNSYYRYTMKLIPALSASSVAPTGATFWDTNLSIMEDISETYFSTPQISSCCRFDDSSFIVVKKNKILLYSVGAGEYWKYNGSYTNIHQVAVMNNKIYVACRSTGLWVIDPYNSLTPTSLASPGGGIDLSICNGVAKGYGNIIWAVANNCLASYNGTTWTKYDSTTTPAFTMVGVSDNNWGNIEYIKVDEDSVDNQMLLVRKYNATSNPTLLGVWWSTVGVASNTGAETAPTGTNIGRPRIHRGQVGGLGGYWLVLVQNQWRSMTFGGTAFTSMTNVTSYPAVYNAQSSTVLQPTSLMFMFQSVIFVKNTAGQVRSWHIDSVATSSYTGQGFYDYAFQIGQKTVNNSNTIIDSYTTTTSGLTTTQYEIDFGVTYYPDGAYGWGIKSSTQVGYAGGQDLGHNFMLAPGIMVTIYNLWSYYTSSLSGRNFGINTRIMNVGLDYTQSGGSMNYVAQQEYGWDGSQWVLNNANGRPTHTSAENLFDGVTIRFEEGASGTSFVSNNFYKFGLCEGLLKDNATRAIYSATPYYIRKPTAGLTDLESSVVPTLRGGQTGVVGVDFYSCSGGVTVNGNSEVIFPGQNVRQYAMGDKPLIGDFVLSIDVTNLNATDVKNAACIGVTRRDWVNNGLAYFGFICSGGTLYYYDNGTTGSIATITAGTTTSLEIRRVGATLTLWRNGTNVRTMAGTGIRVADYILDVLFGVWDHRDCVYLPATGTRVPKATITSNGSSVYVNMGNPTTRTGMYSDRFFGVDFTTLSASTVVMNGLTITPKTDGTAPAAGEITVDSWRGVLYFNSADIGKSLTANYLVLNS